MAISDVLRRAIGKWTPSTSSNIGFNEDMPTPDADSSGWDSYVPALTHSHTFNTYTPNTESPTRRSFKFPSHSKWIKSKSQHDDTIDRGESFKSKSGFEREKGVDERNAAWEKERAKKKRDKRSNRPQHLKKMDRFSWSSASANASAGWQRDAASTDGEQSADVSPTDTRNNSWAEDRRLGSMRNAGHAQHNGHAGNFHAASGDNGVAEFKRLML